MTMIWPFVGLLLFLIYLAVGFGVRTVVQIRRTGDTGFRGLSGSVGSAEWWAGVLFAAAVVMGLLGPVAGLFGLADLPGTGGNVLRAAGAALAVVGIIGTFITQLAMGDSWRVGVDEAEQTELVTQGPFALVRNPIFTAMLLTGAGIALVVPNVIALMGWVLLLIAIELQVRVVEEPYLVRSHGTDYLRYAEATGRFLPALGRLGIADPVTDSRLRVKESL